MSAVSPAVTEKIRSVFACPGQPRRGQPVNARFRLRGYGAGRRFDLDNRIRDGRVRIEAVEINQKVRAADDGHQFKVVGSCFTARRNVGGR